jgi:hypothetical protein
VAVGVEETEAVGVGATVGFKAVPAGVGTTALGNISAGTSPPVQPESKTIDKTNKQNEQIHLRIFNLISLLCNN